MRPITILASTSVGGVTAPVILDQYLTPFNVTLTVELYGTSGGSYTVQYSNDDPYGIYVTSYNVNANWYPHSTLVNLSADATDVFYTPVRACRLLTNTVGTGSTQNPQLEIIQAGMFG